MAGMFDAAGAAGSNISDYTSLPGGTASAVGDAATGGDFFDYLKAGGALAGGAAHLASGQHQVGSSSMQSSTPPRVTQLQAPTQALAMPTSAYPTQPNSVVDALPSIPPQQTQHLADILNALAHIKI